MLDSKQIEFFLCAFEILNDFIPINFLDGNVFDRGVPEQ